MVETHADVKAAITKRLDDLSKEDLDKVLQFVDSPSSLPRGMTTAEAMQMVGTLSHEDAEEMRRIIEEGCEQVNESGW
jgi:hypothetical protein